MSDDKREPFNVKCKKCLHVWTAAYVPMEMLTMAAILRDMRCQMCGVDSQQIFTAPKGATSR